MWFPQFAIGDPAAIQAMSMVYGILGACNTSFNASTISSLIWFTRIRLGSYTFKICKSWKLTRENVRIYNMQSLSCTKYVKSLPVPVLLGERASCLLFPASHRALKNCLLSFFFGDFWSDTMGQICKIQKKDAGIETLLICNQWLKYKTTNLCFSYTCIIFELFFVTNISRKSLVSTWIWNHLSAWGSINAKSTAIINRPV